MVINTLHKERDRGKSTSWPGFQGLLPSGPNIFLWPFPSPHKASIFQSCEMMCHAPKVALQMLSSQTFSKPVFPPAFPRHGARSSSSCSLALSPQDFPGSVRYTPTLLYLPSCGLSCLVLKYPLGEGTRFLQLPLCEAGRGSGRGAGCRTIPFTGSLQVR